MYKFCFIVTALTFFAIGNAQDLEIQKTLPSFSAKMLSGDELSFPAKSSALFIIGFDKNCILQVREWVTAIRREKLLSCPCYVISVLNPKSIIFGDVMALKVMRQIIPKKEHGVVGLTVCDSKLFKDYYDSHLSGVLLFLVNKDGVIQWKHQGSLNDEAKSALKHNIFVLSEQ